VVIRYRPAMSALTRLAEFVAKTSLDDCPPAGLLQIRRATLDTLGVILAGASEPVARIVRALIRVEGGLPLCTVAGASLRTSPTWAALANGAAGHAHDFDDTSFALMGHPSISLVAAGLAAGEAAMADGRTVALGYAVGFEVAATLGGILNPAHYARGWHATSTIGTLGAAAAAARVGGLEIGQIRHALGIACSLASGLKENFGSMTKPYHAGHAARNGVLAAELARLGMTASEDALDGSQGYLAAFGEGAEAKLPAALDALGQRWHLVTTGIAVKPYPSCALTHSAVDALIELGQAHGLRPDDVAGVEIGVNAVVPEVLRHPVPATGLEQKFSMPYCAAVALAHRRLDLGSFADGPVQDPAVRDLMPRVRMVVDPALPAGLDQQAWSRVTVRLADGRTLALPPRGARGHPDHPLPAEALRAKFLACAAPALSPAEAEAVAEQVEHLEEIPDIRALTSRLAGAAE
jgi:2-methylcitrate dehydratase PrpD